MAMIKYAGEEAISRIANYVNSKLKFVSSMPESPDANTIVLYVGADTSAYKQGGIYQYDGTDWNLINLVKTIELTQAEYDALPSAVQNNGTIYFVTDAGGASLAGKEILRGYLNPIDGKFYVENTYTTELDANVDILYIDLNTYYLYIYDSANTIYVKVGGGGGEVDTELSPISENPVQNKVITNVIPYKGFSDTWSEKTWNGLTDFNGDYVWTDRDNIYYSNGSSQYVLDKNTNTWNSKTWNGLSNFDGDCIWTDGENIYYSYGDSYVLDKSTSTWNSKTWNVDMIAGWNIWTDGNDIYVSDTDNGQYVLDKSTDTWNPKTWNGLTNFQGECIWTDGENIYYSTSETSDQYVLDKSTDTWNPKTWNGFGNPDGFNFWTDGENIYYSYETSQYVLDKTTSTLNLKTWNGLNNFRGYRIWNDGENIYLSNGSTQYSLSKSKGFGTSASKDYINTVTNGSKDLVTSGAVYSAIDTAIGQVLNTPF